MLTGEGVLSAEQLSGLDAESQKAEIREKSINQMIGELRRWNKYK